jgi:glucose/arabinose dehydrogenase
MKRYLLLALLAAPAAMSAQVLNKPKVAVRNWATGFSEPTTIANCGDSRLFVVEKEGIINIVSDSMTVLPTPFLDISDIVNSSENEQGLLGLAFEPDYLTSGYFYVYYTHGDPYFDRMSRFQVTSDPNVADPASEQVLVDVADPEWNHNGGDLHFGSDGYLYIGFGDGGGGNDQHGAHGNGQDYTEPLGGMFRIDVSEHNDHYLVPPTNAFSYETGTDTLPELWAVGLRNPWRYSFDRLTGDLWIGDVGQNAWEEVDKWPALGNSCPNFGWRCREAFVATPGVSQSGCQGASAYVSPLAAFDHDGQGWCSVIGGYVYRGAWYPHHYGHYIFTDYCGGDFLTFSDETNTDVDTMLMTTTSGYAAMGEDMDGQLYVANQLNGQVKKLYDPCPMDDPAITSVGDLLTATEGNSYQWFLNGSAISGATDQTYLAALSGDYQVQVNFGAPCTLISDTLDFVASGVAEHSATYLSVFPQPAKDILTIERGTSDLAVTARLFDALGRSVSSTIWPMGQQRLNIDVARLPVGSYSLRCEANDGRTISRIPLVIAR